VRYFEGAVADAYLQRRAPARGYSVVVFRTRHVGDPQSMSADERGQFWSDVMTAARAIERVYEPIHLNFQILGNRDPHVHVHVVPRYNPDPAPSLPLPAAAWDTSHSLEGDELREAVVALSRAVCELAT
jgi:diadenosine tetraphosphate (Ap4A) HIT family hydrolase